MILNKINEKQAATNSDEIEQWYKVLEREIIVTSASSTTWNVTLKNYLLQGILLIIIGKIRASFQEDKVVLRHLGNWITV